MLFERKNHFGLRKLNIGMVSVVLGTLLLVGTATEAHASEAQEGQLQSTAKVDAPSNAEAQASHSVITPETEVTQQEPVENERIVTDEMVLENVEENQKTPVETQLKNQASITDEEEETHVDSSMSQSSSMFRAANEVTANDTPALLEETTPKVREQLVDGEVQRIYQKRVAVMQNAPQTQSVGIQRGTYQARDSLGIIVPANTKLYIHQAGPEKLTDLRVSLMTNDGAYNKSQVVPKTGEWVTIETGIDSAAFMYMPSGLAYQPIVAYYVEHQRDVALPTYRKGESQAAFEQQWLDQDAAYAYVNGDHHAMLIPRIDRARIMSMKTQTSEGAFKSLDEMIDFYEDVIAKYNSWVGFNDDATSVNYNVGSKYFIVANKNGFGAAYWSTDHTGTNSPSIAPYLQRGWLMLHELGHDYDGWMAQDNRMDLLEVINNVFANQYEQMIQHNKNGWLYGDNQQAFQRGIHDRLLAGDLHFNASGFKGKLDFMTRLVRLTGIEGMTQMYQTMRAQAAQGHTKVDVPKWISHDWLAAQGVNGLPYFDLYHIDMVRDLKDALNAYHHSYIYPLAMLIDDAIERQKYVARLGLATEYELVKSSDLSNTSIHADAVVRLNLQGQSLHDHAKVILMDGKDQVAEAVVNDGVATFKQLRVGVYKIVAPETVNHMLPERAYLVVRENGENQVVMTYPTTEQTQQFVSQQILLKGLGNELFARIVYQPQTGEVKYQEYATKPHVYFNDEYAYVTIHTQAGQVVLDRSMIGNQVGEALTKIRKLAVGDTITIKHREPGQRRVVERIETGERVVMKDAEMQTVTYKLTDKGFIVNDETQQDAERRYMETLEKDINTWIANKTATPDKDDRIPLYRLVRAVQALQHKDSERLMARLAPYLDRNNVVPVVDEQGIDTPTTDAEPINTSTNSSLGHDIATTQDVTLEEPKVDDEQPVEEEPEAPEVEDPQPVEEKPVASEVDKPQLVEEQPEAPKVDNPQPAEEEPEAPEVDEPQSVEEEPEAPEVDEPQPVEEQPEAPKEDPQPVQPQPEVPKIDDIPSANTNPASYSMTNNVTQGNKQPENMDVVLGATQGGNVASLVTNTSRAQMMTPVNGPIHQGLTKHHQPVVHDSLNDVKDAPTYRHPTYKPMNTTVENAPEDQPTTMTSNEQYEATSTVQEATYNEPTIPNAGKRDDMRQSKQQHSVNGALLIVLGAMTTLGGWQLIRRRQKRGK
ncbi:MAG: putative mucin/carbohydrate-binding domain-containing protein [Staphylococcus rostri]|uniref:putative mucin/carbohydrate-binding domain-containing protein n=1 Tax=Staphylococcus rostri TaxID=522262 RepID=UPI0026DF59F9|nr:putative mucin/carbohydrate-binding domain-containing protein [Staphylococcus rostri]MDO5376248.1 putative mucin/carbohydrate-binding domain-containing protein [Staphylococcus rostri]